MFVGKIYNLPKDFIFYKPFTLRRLNQRKNEEIYYRNLIWINDFYKEILVKNLKTSEDSSYSWEMLERKNL